MHFLAAENLQIQLADSGCAACMRKLQEVGKAWHAAMSIFSWSSLPGPQVLVSSAVRSGGQVTGPNQWNVAESIRCHFYDWPIRTPHPHPHPHLHPCSKILVLVVDDLEEIFMHKMERTESLKGGSAEQRNVASQHPSHLLIPADQNK